MSISGGKREESPVIVQTEIWPAAQPFGGRMRKGPDLSGLLLSPLCRRKFEVLYYLQDNKKCGMIKLTRED